MTDVEDVGRAGATTRERKFDEVGVPAVLAARLPVVES
jgi:hypothetical protein